MLKNILSHHFLDQMRHRTSARLKFLLSAFAVVAAVFVAPHAHAQIFASASFAPGSVVTGANAVLTITVINSSTFQSFNALATNVALPLSGFQVVGPAAVSNTCPTTVNLSVVTQITFTALGVPAIGPGSSCTITVNVIATGLASTTGTFTIPLGSLAVVQGTVVNGPGVAVIAGASITAPPSTMTVAVAPTTVLTNTAAVLTYTLTNPDTAAAFISGGTINLPSTLTASVPTNTCGTFLSPFTSGYTFGMGFVPANGSCTITFNVQSPVPNTFVFNVVPGNLTAPTNNTNSSTTTLNVVAPAPAITLAGAPVTFAPQTIATVSPAQVVTLTNSGVANLILNAPTSTGPFAFTTTCPIATPPVAPAGTCTFTITFSPTLVGAAVGTIDFTSNAPTSPTSIALSGTGAAVAVPGVALIPVPPTPLAFAAQTVATTSAAQNIVLTNTGTANLLITAVNVTSAPGVFTRVLPPSGPTDCIGVLAPATQCAIAITFSPAAVGAAAGNVQIITNATPTTYNVPLNGTGAVAAVGLIALSGALNFGDQIIGTSSNPQSVLISNVGSGFFFVSGLGFSGVDANDFTLTGGCGGLLPGASCAVDVVFNPATIGSKNAQLNIGSDAQNAASANAVGLSGNGVPVPRPLATLSATAVGFGNTIFGGAAAPKSVVLTNAGTLPLLIQSATTSAEYTQINNCPASLNPQASCTISLSFTPYGLGPRTGEFILNSNTADSPNRVLLSGNGCRWFKPPGSRLFANICRN